MTEEEADLLTCPITKEEIKNSILKLKNHTSPGVDGLPGECYKMFEKELMPLLEKVYNYALSKADGKVCILSPHQPPFVLTSKSSLPSLQRECKNI